MLGYRDLAIMKSTPELLSRYEKCGLGAVRSMFLYFWDNGTRRKRDSLFTFRSQVDRRGGAIVFCSAPKWLFWRTEVHLLVLGSPIGVPFATRYCDTGVIIGLHLLAANRAGSYAQTPGQGDVVVRGVAAGRGYRARLLPSRFRWGV